jgi:hypothetical protein
VRKEENPSKSGGGGEGEKTLNWGRGMERDALLEKRRKKKGVTPQKRPRKMMPSETGEDG